MPISPCPICHLSHLHTTAYLPTITHLVHTGGGLFWTWSQPSHQYSSIIIKVLPAEGSITAHFHQSRPPPPLQFLIKQLGRRRFTPSRSDCPGLLSAAADHTASGCSLPMDEGPVPPVGPANRLVRPSHRFLLLEQLPSAPPPAAAVGLLFRRFSSREINLSCYFLPPPHNQ